MRISSVNLLDLYYFIMYYLFSSMCTQKFYDFMCFSELSYPKCPVLDSLWWNYPLIHTWSTYLISNRYVHYTYFLVVWIEGFFLIALFLTMLLKKSPPQWLHLVWDNFLPRYFYWMVQIQIINVQFRSR